MVKCGCEGESGIDASIACLLRDVSVEGCVCMVWGGVSVGVMAMV